jgi:hypothetical protein
MPERHQHIVAMLEHRRLPARRRGARLALDLHLAGAARRRSPRPCDRSVRLPRPCRLGRRSRRVRSRRLGLSLWGCGSFRRALGPCRRCHSRCRLGLRDDCSGALRCRRFFTCPRWRVFSHGCYFCPSLSSIRWRHFFTCHGWRRFISRCPSSRISPHFTFCRAFPCCASSRFFPRFTSDRTFRCCTSSRFLRRCPCRKFIPSRRCCDPFPFCRCRRPSFYSRCGHRSTCHTFRRCRSHHPCHAQQRTHHQDRPADLSSDPTSLPPLLPLPHRAPPLA